MTAAQQVPQARGDCYEAAFMYLWDNRNQPHLRLVHAEVAGQGPLQGRTLGHAWVEDGGMVIDRSNGRNVRMPKWQYYRIGKVLELNNIHRYSLSQARDLVIEHNHFGPWDLETAL